MTKITLESRGISVSINNSNAEEDNIESIGFAFLGKIAEEALNKINNQRKLNKVSDHFDNSEEEDGFSGGASTEDEDEDEDEDEYDETEESEYEEDEDEEPEESEDDENDDEDDDEGLGSSTCSKNSNKKHSCTPSQCLNYIKSNNKEDLVKLVKKSSKKIRISGTNKEQRNWVYKIFSDIDNISTWSLSSRNGRVLIIDSSNKN